MCLTLDQIKHLQMTFAQRASVIKKQPRPALALVHTKGSQRKMDGSALDTKRTNARAPVFTPSKPRQSVAVHRSSLQECVKITTILGSVRAGTKRDRTCRQITTSREQTIGRLHNRAQMVSALTVSSSYATSVYKCVCVS